MSDETSSAIAELKKYLPDPVRRIELHDFMINEVRTMIDRVQDLRVSIATGAEVYAEQVTAYETASEQLLSLLVVGAFHSNSIEHDRLWARCVDYLASRMMESNGTTFLLDLQQYPTFLALHALGLGAVAAERIESIAHVLGSVRVRNSNWSAPVGVSVGARGALNSEALKQAFPQLARHKTPISDHVLEYLRPLAADFVPSDDRLNDMFDEVEYLLGIVYAAHKGEGWGPLGRAVWRAARSNQPPGEFVDRNVELLINFGLFDNSHHLAETKKSYDEALRTNPFRY